MLDAALLLNYSFHALNFSSHLAGSNVVSQRRQHCRRERRLKIFQRYNPLQVAKYVKILFRGRLYIKNVGAFEFDKGKILIPRVKDKLHLSVMSEVNHQVTLMQAEAV